MSESNFVDYVKIFCQSGNGGPGSAHLRREKFVPKGGPDGGDGGRGGHIILKGNSQLWTLLHLKYHRHIKAGHGGHGGKQCRFGASGEDKVIEVPLGTVVKDAESGNFLAEVTHEGETLILFEGGRGGLGNTHFKSATQQTPRFAQPGEPGIEAWVIMELKILADVGLVGFPSSGKSTLLSVVSAAKPKIADYPFTTLVPNIGIVSYRDQQSFVMADIPGIIEGAHAGRGLGLRFLRHIERNAMLLILVPADSKDHRKEYFILMDELGKYNPELLDKQRFLVISKADMLDDVLMAEISRLFPDIPHLFISSVSGYQIVALKDKIWQILKEN
ncbi:MAG: GTPase ObgE [Prolixibacteraceae bacterium]|jgi:GTP-binding protein|nr:GTPase ObgE [Prolixibacteraceae bacterium]MDI9564317.1 GTPase ObgE [Bacteroidota bacterium]NLS99241.1 GTPase ObgE [Bacteroidales bacterium]OQB79669.1 MAG: GTPase Obg/CgtA [Bacteroidetes bacterium ADurb.Bin123]HNU77074.1 GTPase ObgE [Prolixibacteraceae bacterium]